jgi:Ca2+-dependent lipid-binding protein
VGGEEAEVLTQGSGKSDPFVKVCLLSGDGKEIKATKNKTKVQKKTLEPTWDEEFTM